MDDADETAQNEPQSAKPSGAGDRAWQAVRPLVDQATLNLRVWIPALSTPDMKGRQVRYRARENRVGLKWQVALPQQCWQCGKTTGVEQRESSRSVRCFDNPVAIVSGAYGSAVVLLLLWAFLPWGLPLKLAILLAIGGSALLFIKSWKERVRIVIWTCPEHAADLPDCGCAVNEDELYLFVPSESLAETARAEQQAARRREQGPPASKAASDASAPPPPSAAEPPSPSRSLGSRTELPPLKLDGEEDEAPGP